MNPVLSCSFGSVTLEKVLSVSEPPVPFFFFFEQRERNGPEQCSVRHAQTHAIQMFCLSCPITWSFRVSVSG